MRIIQASLCFVALAPFTLHAQIAETGEEPAEDRPLHWGIGVAGAIRTEMYAGEGNHSRVIPYVTYEGERLYWRGATVGYHLVKRDGFVFDGFIAGRLGSIDADDFGVEELARRGIDRDLLEDRDDSADAGISALWRGSAGEVALEFKADITDTSGGYEADVSYRYPMRFASVTITPSIGVTALSKDMANYYYGTLDEEIARGVVEYRPGSATIPHVGIAVVKPFAQQWRLIAGVEYQVLPDEIKDSPLVEQDTDGVGRLFLGVSRGF
jgi:MipA family protein